MGTISVRDQAPGGADFELEIELDAVEVTAGELIRGRVAAELARVGSTVPRPIVPASPVEEAINGRRRDGRRLDPQEETQKALEAFEQGRFVLLVDGRQIASTEERFTLTPDADVTFVQLIPLRGG